MKKRGFTLIELLAVIVILAIIALIATPIVMNVIENAKKGAAERSAENYLRAVETAIASERLDGPITDGVYSLDGDGNLVHADDFTIKITVEVSGDIPTSVTILIQNGQIVTQLTGDIGQGKENIVTTITIKGETFNRNDEGKLEVVEKHDEVEKVCKLSNDVNGNGEVDLGDEIKCIKEEFIVVPNDTTAHPTATEGNITLLAKYNLNVGNHTQNEAAGKIGLQNPMALGAAYNGSTNNLLYNSCNFTQEIYNQYITSPATIDKFVAFYNDGYGCRGSLPFATAAYWTSGTEKFVYTNHSKSFLYPHVENYKTYLTNNGVDIKEASLMSKNQVTQIKNLKTQEGLYQNFKNSNFWLGTIDREGYVYSFVFLSSSMGSYIQTPFYFGYDAGVRPIIVVDKNDIGV